MLLRHEAYSILVIGMRGETGILLWKAQSDNKEEAERAKREIIKEAREWARHIANLSMRIAEMYGWVEEAWKMRDYETAYKGLQRIKELTKEHEEACEIEKKWREAFWKVIGGERE